MSYTPMIAVSAMIKKVGNYFQTKSFFSFLVALIWIVIFSGGLLFPTKQIFAQAQSVGVTSAMWLNIFLFSSYTNPLFLSILASILGVIARSSAQSKEDIHFNRDDEEFHQKTTPVQYIQAITIGFAIGLASMSGFVIFFGETFTRPSDHESYCKLACTVSLISLFISFQEKPIEFIKDQFMARNTSKPAVKPIATSEYSTN